MQKGNKIYTHISDMFVIQLVSVRRGDVEDRNYMSLLFYWFLLVDLTS